MKKILGLLIVVLVVSMTTAVYAKRMMPSMTDDNRVAYKNMLKNYLHPVMSGYGIGLLGDNYLTAKWSVVEVRTLSTSQIKDIVNRSNATSWSELKDEVQNALRNASTVKKARIEIGSTNYVLTNIQVSNTTLSAEIRSLPNYEACKSQNITDTDCENNAQLMGSLSVAKKNAVLDSKTNTKVWAGTLNFNSTAYTFVSFANPGGKIE
jgi:hypothetical protein